MAVAVTFLAASGSLSFAQTNESAAAFNDFYNLDYESSIKEFRGFTSAHPASIEGWNYLAQAIFYSAVFDCGIMGSDLIKDNSVILHSPKVTLSAERDRELQSAMGKAQSMAEESLRANPRDAKALYELGITYGLRANYEFLTRHAWLAGLRAANESRKLHEQVMKLEPDNYDARLIPGTHQYMVGTLPLFARIAARATGVSGDRVEGLRKIEATAARGDSAKLDAQILLAALYRREHRSAAGIPILSQLADAYPRNFIFRIELAKLYADTGDKARATDQIDQINHLIAQSAPGYCSQRVAMIRRQEGEVGEQIAQIRQGPSEIASAAAPSQVHANLLK